MKTILKVSLAVMGIGALIGLGTHIDAAYNNAKSKEMTEPHMAESAKPVKKSRRAKNAHKMMTASNKEQVAAAPASKKHTKKEVNPMQKGGIAFIKKDEKSNENYFMFKQMDQKNANSSSNIFNVAMPVVKENMTQDVKRWGHMGKLNLFVKEVNSWQKPAHDKNAYVWVSESELNKAVDTAMKKHDFANVTVQART